MSLEVGYIFSPHPQRKLLPSIVRSSLTATSAASHLALGAVPVAAFFFLAPSDPLENSLATLELTLIAGGCCTVGGAHAGPNCRRMLYHGGSPCWPSHPAHVQLFPRERKVQAVRLARQVSAPGLPVAFVRGCCKNPGCIWMRINLGLGIRSLQGHELVSTVLLTDSELFKEFLGQSKGLVT